VKTTLTSKKSQETQKEGWKGKRDFAYRRSVRGNLPDLIGGYNNGLGGMLRSKEGKNGGPRTLLATIEKRNKGKSLNFLEDFPGTVTARKKGRGNLTKLKGD